MTKKSKVNYKALHPLNKDQALPVVDYTAKEGAQCPECQVRMRTTTTRPWEGNTRERYHTCGECGLKARSIEEFNSEDKSSTGGGFRSDPTHPMAR